MRKKVDSKKEEAKNVAIECGRRFYILALQRVLQAPKELRSTLQDLNMNLQQYMNQHCMHGDQVQAAWLSLLPFLDMITALSLANVPDDTNFDDEIEEIKTSGLSIEDLENVRDWLIKSNTDFEYETVAHRLQEKRSEYQKAKREYKYQAFMFNEYTKDYIANHKENTEEEE